MVDRERAEEKSGLVPIRRKGLPADAPRRSTDEQQHAADDDDVDRYKETCLAENRHHLLATTRQLGLRPHVERGRVGNAALSVASRKLGGISPERHLS